MTVPPPDIASLNGLDGSVARATRALEDAVVLASYAAPGDPRYAALAGNVRTTSTELARRLLAMGQPVAAVRDALHDAVARGATQGHYATDRVAALLWVVDSVLDEV
jgi:hypothetical protein